MIRVMTMFVLLCSIFSVWAETAPLAPQSTKCTREGLQKIVDQYLDALEKGNPSLMPLSAQAQYMENRNDVPLGQGIWQTPLTVDFNRSMLDVDTCQTFTEIIHTSSDHPYVIGTRLQIEGDKISKIVSLVADQDDWLFNAEDYLKYSSRERWDLLPVEKQSDRQTLLDAANAYFDTFGDYSSFSKVPWGTPCARIEGGMYTNPNSDPNASCTVGMPKDSSVPIINRHFLVDIDMGAVVGMVDFRADKRNPDVHTFRLENGKLRYVHAIQVCTIQPNCGLPPFKPKPQQTMKIKTLEQARRFVIKEQICTIFPARSKTLKSLWDFVDLPDKQPGETGWGAKITAVWGWKNQLPARYPREIFYGKMKGGAAVLMTLDYLRHHHYPRYHQDIRNCRPLAQQIYELISQDSCETTALRRDSMEQFGCTKSQFDTALKELQVTLNIVRSNEPGVDRDTWLPFQEIYLEIYLEHHPEP